MWRYGGVTCQPNKSYPLLFETEIQLYKSQLLLIMILKGTTASVILFTERIQNADIPAVASNLPDWELVAKELGFGEQEITEMKDKRISKVEETKRFLRRWTSRDGSKATYTKLYEVLISLHQQGAAEEIHKRSEYYTLLVEQTCFLSQQMFVPNYRTQMILCTHYISHIAIK